MALYDASRGNFQANQAVSSRFSTTILASRGTKPPRLGDLTNRKPGFQGENFEFAVVTVWPGRHAGRFVATTTLCRACPNLPVAVEIRTRMVRPGGRDSGSGVAVILIGGRPRPRSG